MNRIGISALAALTILSLATGCRTTSSAARSSRVSKQPGAWRCVAVSPRADLPRIHSINKVNPVWWFKNLDDPKPPEWYLPKGHLRKLRWYGRNSFHNFDFYVIGVADKKCVRCGKHPEDIGNPDGGWNYAVTKYRWLRLPFLSFQGRKVEWYLGWRNNGNFGIALRRSHRLPMTAPALAKQE